MKKKSYKVDDLLSTVELAKRVCDSYKDHKSIQQISIKEGITMHTVISILNDNEVEMRKRNNR